MNDSMAGAQDPEWVSVEKICAITTAFLLGTRFEVYTQITVGYLVAIALMPVWLPVLLRVRPAKVFFLMVGLCLLSGFALALWRAMDHATNGRRAGIVALELIGIAASCGAMVWAYAKVGAPSTLLSFGIASLVFVDRGSDLYSVSPWRFGFSVPATIVVLALATFTRRRLIDLLALAATVIFAAFGGGRSASATQCMALVFLILWMVAGKRFTRRSSLGLAATFVGLLAWAVYNVGQALISEGILGEAARDRSNFQVQSGSGLLLGGRPELGATIALFGYRVWGFGLGVRPNWADIQAGREGMASLGFDPSSGYVDNYMFGGAFRLHSIVGELWAIYGLFGIVLAVIIAWHAVAAVANGPHRWGVDTLLLTAAMKTSWNLLFSPWLTSIPMLVILLSLVWFRRYSADQPTRSGPP